MSPLRASRWRYVVAALVVVVVVAVIVWAVTRGAGENAAAPTPSPSLSEGLEPTAEPSDAVPSASPSASDPSAAPAVPGGEGAGGVERPTADPVPLEAPAELGTEAIVRVTSLEAVAGTGQGAGEIAGPAIRVNLTIENRTAEAISLASMVVNFTYGSADTPAISLSGPGRVEFGGVVAPGGQATGSYVFNVPVDQRDLVRVWVDYRLELPVAVFEGPAPTA